MKHPIDNIKWIDVNELSANDYNPNNVFKKEMELLEFSILKQGYIQPILITQDNVIIDGFHRATIARASKKIHEKYGTKIPCCILNLSEPERMMLTIRINRAKGSHQALKMSHIIKELINKHGLNIEQVGSEIGANKDEIMLLLNDNVFKALKIDKHKYSKAWVPK